MVASRDGNGRIVFIHEWMKLYKEAVVETDDTKLKIRAEEAENAIFRRLQELAYDHSGNHYTERSDIQTALAGLRRLQVERLKFPSFPAETNTLNQSTGSA